MEIQRAVGHLIDIFLDGYDEWLRKGELVGEEIVDVVDRHSVEPVQDVAMRERLQYYKHALPFLVAFV